MAVPAVPARQPRLSVWRRLRPGPLQRRHMRQPPDRRGAARRALGRRPRAPLGLRRDRRGHHAGRRALPARALHDRGRAGRPVGGRRGLERLHVRRQRPVQLRYPRRWRPDRDLPAPGLRADPHLRGRRHAAPHSLRRERRRAGRADQRRGRGLRAEVAVGRHTGRPRTMPSSAHSAVAVARWLAARPFARCLRWSIARPA